jgi:signal transduction histidine kinase
MLERARRVSESLPRFSPSPANRATRYLIAIALTGVAAGLRAVMMPADAGLPFVTFFPAAALSAIFGGIGPGLVSTLLGAGLATYYFAPESGVSVMTWGLVVFVVDEVIVCMAIEAMHRYYRRYSAIVGELASAREEADMANRAKSDFLATMSHELRTPLNAVIGFADAIVSDIHHEDVPPRYIEYVMHIHESGEHLLDLINDVLDISAIEAGRMELRPETVATADLIGAALRLIGPRAKIKRLHLSTELSAAPPFLTVDPRRIKQILVNLLGNAVKFTPANGKVMVVAEALHDGGVRFVVTDSGIGMDAAGIEKALTAFGQVDNATSRDGEGSGLGLPLSVRLVKTHGGRLVVDSSPGKGTSVSVILPPACVARAPVRELVLAG